MIFSSILLLWALNFNTLDNYTPFKQESISALPTKISDKQSFFFNKNKVYTLNIKNSKKTNSFYLPSTPYSQPLLKDGILYYYSIDGKINAYSLKSASQVWEKDIETLPEDYMVIYKNDLLIAYTSYNQISGIDLKTGKTIWTYQKDRNTSKLIEKTRLNIILKNSTAFFALNNYFIALNILTGVPLIEKLIATKDNDSISNLKNFLDGFVVGTRLGEMIYIDQLANILWVHEDKYSEFITQNNRIIVSNGEELFTLNKQKEKTILKKTNKHFPYEIKIINNFVFIAHDSGFSVYDLEKGDNIYTFKNNTGIKNLLSYDNIIIAISNKNILYTFKLN